MRDAADKRGLTVYGATVMGLAVERGYFTQKAFARALNEHTDEKVNEHKLGRWLRGEHAPPWWVNELIADVLDLDDDALTRLARANTFGQKEVPTHG